MRKKNHSVGLRKRSRTSDLNIVCMSSTLRKDKKSTFHHGISREFSFVNFENGSSFLVVNINKSWRQQGTGRREHVHK